jgi:formate dehydrogenase iron-sulfur subunit
MSKAMLIDTTRCIGCRGCQVACKSWNDLGARPGAFAGASGTSPRHLDAENFTRVIFRDVPTADGGVRAVYVKRQCMHCNDPACAAACPVSALKKTAAGPVVYDDARCIGCRYCMLACPFNVPKFQWDARAPYIRKCTFCADRQALGKKPSCAATCPAEAIAFGERDELLAEAHRRIAARPAKYAPEVYGERTGGGTSVLYLTPVPVGALEMASEGFRTDLGDVPHGRYTREWMANVPLVGLTVGGLALGLYHLNQRRDEVKKQDGKEVSR